MLLPAPAGRVLSHGACRPLRSAAPSTRGDGPCERTALGWCHFCSPHPVGMAPTRSVRRARKGTAFRTSGDRPLFQADLPRRNGCSLHPRGWSRELLRRGPADEVCSPLPRGWSLSRCPPNSRAPAALPRLTTACSGRTQRHLRTGGADYPTASAWRVLAAAIRKGAVVIVLVHVFSLGVAREHQAGLSVLRAITVSVTHPSPRANRAGFSRVNESQQRSLRCLVARNASQPQTCSLDAARAVAQAPRAIRGSARSRTRPSWTAGSPGGRSSSAWSMTARPSAKRRVCHRRSRGS